MERYFIDEQTLKTIYAPLNSSLINGTLNNFDLITMFLDTIRDTAQYEAYMIMPLQPFCTSEPNDDYWDSEDATHILEDLLYTLDLYAPEGYYFGAHPGNNSDFGYWKDEDEDEGRTFEEVFNECYDNASTEAIISIHNKYCSDSGDMDDYIYVNNDYELSEMFSSPIDAIKAVSYGGYKYGDSYFWFDGLANLQSGNGTYDDMPVNQNDLMRYYEENPGDLAEFAEFEEASEF